TARLRVAGVGCRPSPEVLRAHSQGEIAARGPERVLETTERDDHAAWTVAMQKVISINLNGNAYQLDESGYEALREYLSGAERELAGNPDRAEIVADLEQAIADKCRKFLGAHKSVVSAAEVQQIIKEMGPIDAEAGQDSGDSQGGAGKDK